MVKNVELVHEDGQAGFNSLFDTCARLDSLFDADASAAAVSQKVAFVPHS